MGQYNDYCLLFICTKEVTTQLWEMTNAHDGKKCLAIQMMMTTKQKNSGVNMQITVDAKNPQLKQKVKAADTWQVKLYLGAK